GCARRARPQVTHPDIDSAFAVTRREAHATRATLAGERQIGARNLGDPRRKGLGGFGDGGKTHHGSPCKTRTSSHAENRKRPCNPAHGGTSRLISRAAHR